MKKIEAVTDREPNVSSVADPDTSTAKAASPKKVRYVYYFGNGKADGDGKMKPLLGGKGANLHEMTRIGLPVPPVSPSPLKYARTSTKTGRVIHQG